jgi:hypothetical protein
LRVPDSHAHDQTSSQSVRGAALAAALATGVWLGREVPADGAPHRSTFDPRIAGSSA